MDITTVAKPCQNEAPAKKRRSGRRNADALYRAWLHRSRIPVGESFVSDWIDEAIDRFRIQDDHGLNVLAMHLGVTKRSLIDARKQRVRPVVQFVEKLAGLLGREQELEELLPPPGAEGWGPDGQLYCGDGHEDLNGCGTHFHPHHEGGLCEDCHNGKDDPDFVPRDRRLAKELM